MVNVQELTHWFSLRKLGAGPVDCEIVADAKARAALAERFGLPDVLELTCRFRLVAGQGRSIHAEGWLAARVRQTSVVSGEVFEDALTEKFTLRFVPEAEFAGDDGLDLDAPDILPYEGDQLDLGEVAAEQFGLNLDPYPRRKGEGLESAVDSVPAQGEAEDVEDERPHPFAALAGRVTKTPPAH